MVLVVLALAGTVLAATARQAGREALDASEAMENLQVRWAVRSVRAVAQGQAETWLADDVAAERLAGSKDLPTAGRRTFRLGNLAITVIVTDEEARANVNVLHARGGVAGLAQSLRRLQRDAREAAAVVLAPASPPEGVISRVPRRYRSYAQLFPRARPEELVGFGAEPGLNGVPHGVAERITCWGTGRVNLRRADREVLRQMLAGLATEEEVNTLVTFRDSVPGCSVAEAVTSLELDDSEKVRALAKALTVTSHCHGVWVVARGPSRSWTQLTVRQDGDAENDAGQWRFCW